MGKTNVMSADEVKSHWESWAAEWGINLRATTKTWTIKALEIDALTRAIRKIAKKDDITILEAGCGNGMNCLELAKAFSAAHFDGFDYVPEMVESANENLKKMGGNARFFGGDVLKLGDIRDVKEVYDVVFTDRCLINLTDVKLQKQGISALAAKVKKGGYLIMIENVRQTYDRQNECRARLGMKPRAPAEFNLFFDEDEILPHLRACGLALEEAEDFGSLHDLVLYVLVPSMNKGEVDYAHPLVEAATKLSMKTSVESPGAFGQFGQNRLYLCRKI